MLLLLARAAAAQTCPDKILASTGIGGGGTVTALANVTSQAACCALCHGNYHDECNGWVYGPTTGPDATTSYSGGYAKHNCAIMATNGPPKTIANHVTGICKDAPPTPAPPAHGKACNADINCAPTTAALWRCEKASDASGGAITPENNCNYTSNLPLLVIFRSMSDRLLGVFFQATSPARAPRATPRAPAPLSIAR